MTGTGRTSLRVLVCGGGIAGQAAAYWLAHGGHRVVVAERFPALRAGGAQVDLRGQGIEAVERMGLLDEVRAARVDEAGVAFVDGRGRRWATILANTSGRGRQTLTSEYELMRGDLVRILHEATRDDVDHVFGAGVDGFEQDDERVVAHFSDGSSGEFDLLVGADGQGSRIRQALLATGEDPYRRLGIHMGYWFVPRITADSTIRDTYVAPGGRMIMRRTHQEQTQAYFILREDSAEATAVHRAPVETQQAFWTDRFAGAGWQTDRFIDGMATSSSFYSQEALQVRTSTWSKGRVVLVGDAAHCASPFSGMGISAGLVGAHVLARQVNAHPEDLPRALAAYESELRPFIDTVQASVKPRLLRLSMPKSRGAVTAVRSVAAVAAKLHIPDLVARSSSEDRGGTWRLPPDPQQAVTEPPSDGRPAAVVSV